MPRTRAWAAATATPPRTVAALCCAWLRLRGDIVLDTSTGVVTVGAGVSIDELLRVIVPRGFFIPVTPGTRFVTIGGAIASDIHGKNHHVDGSIGTHVESITMVLADGSTEVIGPHRNPALFWATVGGMGLTGFMLEATIRLLPVETSRMRVDTARLADLDELMAAMSSGDDDVRYSVAWIDLVAKGRHLGRSILSRGDHARASELDARQAVAPFAYGPHQLAAGAATRAADGPAQPRHGRRVQRVLVPQGAGSP